MEDLEDLMAENKRLKKIIEALQERVEKYTESEGTFSLFESNLLLLTEVEKRTQHIKMQDSLLVQAAKMSSLGEMASTIAHEINNPLAIIAMTVENLKAFQHDGSLTPEMLTKSLANIERTAQRVALIVKGMRRLSRDATFDEQKETTPGEIVKNTLNVCGEKFAAEGVSIEVDVPQDVRIKGNCVQLEQVLLNLLSNARYVAEASDERWVKIQCRLHKDKVRIYVIDPGKGIPVEILSNVFKPFFTTKAAGIGTGIGMCVSQKIMIGHGGNLAYKVVDGNTSFYMELSVLRD